MYPQGRELGIFGEQINDYSSWAGSEGWVGIRWGGIVWGEWNKDDDEEET